MLETTNQSEQQAPGGKAWKLFGVVAGVSLVAFNVMLMSRVSYVEDTAERQRVELEDQIADLETQLASRDGKRVAELAALREEIERTARTGNARARNEAARQAGRVSEAVAAKQREQQDMFIGELKVMRSATDTNRNGLQDVSARVEGFESDIASTRDDIATAADLLASTQRNVSDIEGVVGKNASEIERLWRKGQRELVRFELQRSKARQRVGEFHLRLRDADQGKNRYSLEILADDEVTLHKNRVLNEPVAFYVTGVERPYEIVVTSIEKDRVAGFLAKPKFQQMARN